uniref:Cyclic nucleotide-binding domain-containing protein n=1 Tax=Hirondellea gigas TaxID=1518452 RepID=A0A6A7G574_9CRUS
MGNTSSEEYQSSAQSEDVAAVLTTIPFFDTLATQRLKILEDLFERRHFQKGEVVVEQKCQDSTFCFHIIIIGSVQVLVEGEDQRYSNLKVLNRGEWFGESALVGDVMKVTRVVALEDSTILSLSNDKYVDFSDEYGLSVTVKEILPKEMDSSVQVTLKKLPLFSLITEEKRQILASLFRFKRIPRGDIICQQGDRADGFYIIISGRVEVTAHLEHGRMIHLDTLTSGAWFGEVALLEKTPRTATVRALEPCVMLFLGTEEFLAFDKICPEVRSSQMFHSVERQRAANSLKSIPFFRVYQQKQKGPREMFDDQTLALIGELFFLKEFPAGSIIFKQGEPGDALYLIAQGKVEIYLRDVRGNDLSLSELRENSLFGEISLIAGSRRMASARAVTQVVTLTLPQRNCQRFKELSPVLYETLRCLSSVRKAEFFETIPFFAGVRENKPWCKLGLFGALFQIEDADKDAVLFEEGDHGNKFYIIVKGRVDVFVSRDGHPVKIDSLSSNAWFGEISLVLDTPRTATVRCQSQCQFLTLSGENFEKFVKVAPELCEEFKAMISLRTANSLRSMKFFNNSIKENKPWNKLELLATVLQYYNAPPGEVIMEQGSCVSRFYYIVSGACVCHATTKDGETIELERLSANSYFGEMALLENLQCSATITTVETTTFLTLNRKTFAIFLSIAPEVRPEILKTVKARHENMEDHNIAPQQSCVVSERKDSQSVEALSPRSKGRRPEIEESIVEQPPFPEFPDFPEFSSSESTPA